jgi:hypothetical protein
MPCLANGYKQLQLHGLWQNALVCNYVQSLSDP